MRFEILLSPQAVEDLRALKAGVRTAVKEALEIHLRNEPTKTSRSRIKRLRGLSKPQYRLRVEEVRVFYDVVGSTVEVLAIVPKPEANHGSTSSEVPSEGSSSVRGIRRPISVSSRGRRTGNRHYPP